MYRVPKFRDPRMRMHVRISVHEDPRKRMHMENIKGWRSADANADANIRARRSADADICSIIIIYQSSIYTP